MSVRHELRSGNNHPKPNRRASNSAAPLESRWSKNQYGSAEDEDKLYEPDWEIADTDLTAYIDMSLRD